MILTSCYKGGNATGARQDKVCDGIKRNDATRRVILVSPHVASVFEGGHHLLHAAHGPVTTFAYYNVKVKLSYMIDLINRSVATLRLRLYRPET